jgi:outer membrane lipoprotein-sorting protein
MKKNFLALALLLSAIATYAQTADDIINKYIAAIGGVDNWKKINSWKQTGSVITQGMSMPYQGLQARPNLSYTEVEFQGNKFIDAFDGTIAWGQNPFLGATTPTKKSDEETLEQANEPFEDAFMDYKTKGHSVVLGEIEEIEGTKCHKLTLKRASGDEKIYFIHTTTYLPVCVRSFLTVGPNKGEAVDNFESDYRLVEGVQIPHTIEQKVNGQTALTIKIDKIEVNPVIDKSRFSMPVEGRKN